MLEPSQARSRSRRDQLLSAAVELLAEGGARAVTHRAVAARAGVSAASTTYYFSSIADLTNQALARHVEERKVELQSLVTETVAAGGSPIEVGALVATSLAKRAKEVLVAQYEVYLESWRNPELQAPVAAALDAFEATAREALAALGVANPARYAPAFVAAIDGFALHRLARPRPEAQEIEMLQVTLEALFAAAVGDNSR